MRLQKSSCGELMSWRMRLFKMGPHDLTPVSGPTSQRVDDRKGKIAPGAGGR